MHTVPVTNHRIAQFLEAVGRLLQLQDADPYRAMAYLRAAESVRDYPSPIQTMLDQGLELTDLEAIGDRMAAHIREIISTGRLRRLEQLTREVPAGLLDVLAVKDVGPISARRFWKELGICGLHDLEVAARTNRIAMLRGFGLKSQQRILNNIAAVRVRSLRLSYPRASDSSSGGLHPPPGTGHSHWKRSTVSGHPQKRTLG